MSWGYLVVTHEEHEGTIDSTRSQTSLLRDFHLPPNEMPHY